MRNFLLIVTVICIFVVSGICGYYIYEAATKNEEKVDNISKIAKVTVENGVNTSAPSLLTSMVEEKVSPNATLIIKKHYSGCGHTTKDYAEIPAELVNLKEDEVREALTGWELKGFSANEVVILKELTGICNEHYVLREKDGVIAIYTENENGDEILHEITEISTDYLTEQDREELKQGIKAIGKEELNSTIEDYE